MSHFHLNPCVNSDDAGKNSACDHIGIDDVNVAQPLHSDTIAIHRNGFSMVSVFVGCEMWLA